MLEVNNNSQIVTRDDFILLVQQLLEEIDKNPKTWSNNTLHSFVSAIAAWVDDMDGYYLNTGQPVPDQVSWKVFADILCAARFYS